MELLLYGSQKKPIPQIRSWEHASLEHWAKTRVHVKDSERGSRREVRFQPALQESKTRGPERQEMLLVPMIRWIILACLTADPIKAS